MAHHPARHMSGQRPLLNTKYTIQTAVSTTQPLSKPVLNGLPSRSRLDRLLLITETLNYVCLLDQHMSLMRQRLRLMAAEVTRSKPSFLSLYAEGIDPRKYRILWENTAQVKELIYDLVDIDGQHRTLTSRLHGATTHQHQRTKKPDTNTSTHNKGTEAGPFRERSSATSVFVVRRANVIVTNTCSHTLSGTTRSRNVSTDPNLSMEWSSLRTDTFVRTMPIELQAEWMN